MVRLTRIYTRLGDGGDTHLGDMSRARQDERAGSSPTATSTSSTASSASLARRRCRDGYDGVARAIQNDLFDLGADLCVPEGGEPVIASGSRRSRSRGSKGCATRSTRRSSRSRASCCRVARRPRPRCTTPARCVVAPSARPWRWPTPKRSTHNVVAYLNRLSDLLFILARGANAAAGRRRAVATRRRPLIHGGQPPGVVVALRVVPVAPRKRHQAHQVDRQEHEAGDHHGGAARPASPRRSRPEAGSDDSLPSNDQHRLATGTAKS